MMPKRTTSGVAPPSTSGRSPHMRAVHVVDFFVVGAKDANKSIKIEIAMLSKLLLLLLEIVSFPVEKTFHDRLEQLGSAARAVIVYADPRRRHLRR